MTTVNARTAETSTPPRITFHQPDSHSGWYAHQLIGQCPPLDTNSVYCNLLQCSHFSGTSVAAKQEDQLAGFISGYIKPEQTDTLFIWQVAVHESARGQGLAQRMLKHILQRPQCANVRYLETTITEDNQASWRLFEALARSLNAATEKSLQFDRRLHFNNQHDSEWLMRIGPFYTAPLQQEVF